MKRNWVWVDNRLKLQKAIEAINSSSIVGIDTEYDSFRYFREKLCLIQIKTFKKTYLFDPFLQMDLTLLDTSFADPYTTKVLHAGDNDLRILSRDYQFKFNHVFDTQRAAALLGVSHLSLSTVIENFLGNKLEKTKRLQRSQWEFRPLTDEQIQYAVQDTEYLIELYKKMKQELSERGLTERAQQVFEEEIAAAKWSEKTLDPVGHKKIKGYEELTRLQKIRLKALHRWRFQKAKETNMAIFLILNDQELLELVRIKTYSFQTLESIKNLSPRKLRIFGPEIIHLLKTS